MKKMKFVLFFLTFILCSPKIIESFAETQEHQTLLLDNPKTYSLPNKGYSYYHLTLPEDVTLKSNYLLLTVKANTQQDNLDNIVSDPNLFVSVDEKYPDVVYNNWNSQKYGDEIISIDTKYLKAYKEFYISVYCEFKCNYILKAKLYVDYIMDSDTYTMTLNAYDTMKISFQSRKEFNKVTVNAVGLDMKPFKIYLAKERPGNSNTLPSKPIFLNGYYFVIKQGEPFYATEYNYQILIENAEYQQTIVLWVAYNDEEVELEELTELYDNAAPDSPNCYYFNVENPKLNKDIVISTTICNGSGVLKFGGWKKPDLSSEDGTNEVPILTDKSIILTKKEFDSYGEHTENDLHFCFVTTEETSYAIKVYYLENIEKAQTLNYLLPGIRSESILPANNVTRYELVFFDVNRDIYIDLKTKKGNPVLYLYYPGDDSEQFINKEFLSVLKNNNSLINSTKLTYNTYRILVEKQYNKCSYSDFEYEQIFAVIECSGNIDCQFEIVFDHVGYTVTMKPKVTYNNVITKGEIDKYQIPVLEEDVKNIAIVLKQNSGNAKLQITNFIDDDNKNFNIPNLTKNEGYKSNHIEIRAKDLNRQNLKGVLEVQVTGLSFALYDLYYYTFEDSNSDYLDHKTISMQLTKGQIYKDYIKNTDHFKVYSYENNVGSNKKDLFIYLTNLNYENLFIYVFKNLDDYELVDNEIKGYIYFSSYDDYIYISKSDSNYISNGNLYIMVYRKSYDYSSKDSPIYRKYSNISEYSITVTDDDTPISLIEGIEFNNKLTNHHKVQTYYYNHVKNEETFFLSINTPFSKAILTLKIGGQEYMNKKKIQDSYNLEVRESDINTICPSSKSCGVDIKIETADDTDVYTDIVILCRSTRKIPILLKSGIPTKKKILNSEQQYFIVDTPLNPNSENRITAVFTFGRGILYAKRVPFNKEINIDDFPSQGSFDYRSKLESYDNVISITIPNEDIRKKDPFKLLVTVQGNYMTFMKNIFEYYITLSNVVDELIVNKNYKLYVGTGEVKYYRFKIKSNKVKKLSISMTNKKSDGNIYLNYGKSNEISKYTWRSEGAYNEYLDINIDDPFFTGRNKQSLEGEYYLAIDVVEGCFFNLFISDRDIKLLTIDQYDPTTCACDSKDDVCYLRYEVINSEYIIHPIYQTIFFYLEYTYGSGTIYGKLYPNGNNKVILEDLPGRANHQYLSKKEYLQVKLKINEQNYTTESVIVLAVQCKQKSLFDINVKKLNSYDDLTYGNNLMYLQMNMDNVYYISSKVNIPIKLLLNSDKELRVRFEAKSYEGSAKVKVFIGDNVRIGPSTRNNTGYKHLLDFAVDENDESYFGVLEKDDTFGHNVYFEVSAVENCLFFIQLNYITKELLIPMNKEVVGQFTDKMLLAYIKLLPEYDEVVLNIKNDNYNGYGTIRVYEKTNFVSNSDLEKAGKFSYPSQFNFDVKGETNSITKSLSLKIKNVPEEERRKSKLKPLAIFYITTDDLYQTSVSIVAYPNVDHLERIYPEQKKYSYSSLNTLNVDKTIFTLAKSKQDDDLLYLEISACKGNFDYSLSEVLNTNAFQKAKLPESTIIENKKGKVALTIPEIKDDQFYLSVWGTQTDQIYLEEQENKGVDFMLYYYTTKSSELTKSKTNPAFTYELVGKNQYYLYIPEIKTVDSNGKEKIEKNIKYSVVVTEKFNEYKYMDSICFLSKKYDEMQNSEEENVKNIKVTVNSKKNIIEINGLVLHRYYYINVLASNTKTGEIFAYEPVELFVQNTTSYNIIIGILVTVVIILGLVGFYFYRKYRISRSSILYENNDIINMAKLPKSINELQEIEKKKVKESKEKYNSLTEDSGNI